MFQRQKSPHPLPEKYDRSLRIRGIKYPSVPEHPRESVRYLRRYRLLLSHRCVLSTQPPPLSPGVRRFAESPRSVLWTYPCRSCWLQRCWYAESALPLQGTPYESPSLVPGLPDSPAPAAVSCRIFLRNRSRRLHQRGAFSVGSFHGSALWYVLYCPLLFPLSCCFHPFSF